MNYELRITNYKFDFQRIMIDYVFTKLQNIS